MSETNIKDNIMSYLETLAPEGFFWRQGATKYGKSGIADILGCYKGVFVAIEVKTPKAFKKKNNGLTKNQSQFLTNVHEAGGLSVVVCSVDMVKAFFQRVEELIKEKNLSAHNQSQS